MSLLEDEISKVDSSISGINNKEAQLLHPQKSSSSSSSSDPPPVALAVDDIGIKSLEDEKKVLNERRENAVAALKTTWDTEANVTNHDKLKDTSYVTATFLTRIGILAILIFLVQILISLYKYNTRIVAFYVSRLDCLRISGENVEEFRSLIELMTPINVDFGRDPRHPVEVLLEAWRTRGERRRATEGGSTQSRTVTRAHAKSTERPPTKTQSKTEPPPDAGTKLQILPTSAERTASSASSASS